MTYPHFFYRACLEKAGICKDDNLLVICGGNRDRWQLTNFGVLNATISNISVSSMVSDQETTYTLSEQHAEKLTFDDLTFDWAIVHEGLHHCRSPHAALCEMLRVARKGILVMESRDSLLIRLLVRFRLAQSYEVEAVANHGGKAGGVDNSPVPNFVYRWTEREFIKTVQSADPAHKYKFRFNYVYRMPDWRIKMSTHGKIKAVFFAALKLIISLLNLIFPKSANSFAMIAEKSELQDWMMLIDGEIRPDMNKIGKLYKIQVTD